MVSISKNTALHLALVVLLGGVVYSNTLDAPFQWDEITFIVKNPIVKDLGYFLSPSEASRFEQYGAFVNRYVSYLSFALNYRLHGIAVAGYHAFNISIHLINAVLVYLLVTMTYRAPSLHGAQLENRSRLIALFASLLYVSHPVQTEAVTYIFQRHASLAALFFMLSLTAYVKSRLVEDKRAAYLMYAVSLLSAVLAMKTKENAFTLPVVMALYELFFFRSPLKAGALRLVPFFLTMLIVPLTLAGTGQSAGEIIGGMVPATRGYEDITRLSYLLTQFRVTATYIRLLFLPINQNIAHDYPLYSSFLNPGVLFSFLTIASLLGLAARLLYRAGSGRPELLPVSFGILWFFVTLSVESSIVPLPMLINEYRLYLPSAGAFFALAAGVSALYAKLKDGGPRTASNISFVLILALLVPATMSRNNLWKSEIGLWEDTARKSPLKAAVHYNLGNAYLHKNLEDAAIEHFSEATRLDPGYSEAYNNLGIAYFAQGLTDKAAEYYRTAVMLDPEHPEAHNNLGSVYLQNNQLEEAIIHFEEAIRQAPDHVNAHINLGSAYGVLGRTDEALEQLLAAIALEPENAVAHLNLGNAYDDMGMKEEAGEHYMKAARLDPALAEQVPGGLLPLPAEPAAAVSAETIRAAMEENRTGLEYFEKGDLDRAIEHLEEAVRLNPAYPEALYNLAASYQRKNLLDKAIENYLKVLDIRPDVAHAHNNLGLVYFVKGLNDEAIRHLLSAIELNPGHTEAHFNLGNAFMSEGQRERAITHLETAVRQRPDFAEAHNNLGLACTAAGQTEKALGHFQEALRLRPGYASAHFNLGLLYINTGDTERARAELETSLRIDPGFEKARNMLNEIEKLR
jgi:tetratricopeptide (TPR) repeat protein